MSLKEQEAIAINTKPPQFQVGDRVGSKHTGFPGIGTVLASMPFIVWANLTGNAKHSAWDIFINHEEEYVYIVAFEEPRRHLTLEEYLEGMPEQVKNLYKPESLPILYEMTVAARQTITYPEQDLELYE